MRNLLRSRYDPNLIQRPYFWRQTSVHTEDRAIHYRCQVEVVKHFAAVPPYVGVAVLLLTFV